VSQVTVMLAFMFSFVLAMTAVFAASPAIGPDIENGLLLAVLARPIRRSEVLLGRWLGLAPCSWSTPSCRRLPGAGRRNTGHRLRPSIR
jgi:ABC-type transport system involved in multi-copper enzyme maturation permease subunit